ncbi:MAG TPA: hypothetical protein VGH38_04845 [Bryobacteraceae bacterium]
MWPRYLGTLLVAGVCFAQPPYEIGGAIGYGFYRNGTIFGAGTTAEAGIRNRFAAGFVFGEDLYEYISGEVRYLYHDGHPFLASGNVKSDVQGQSHAIHYDLLFHLRPREGRLRPFAAAGVGMKDYVIAGPAPNPQALPNVASLTTFDQWKTLVTVGGGVKYRLYRNLILRGDFLDYLTAFPRRQIQPAANNTARGIFQQFTPLFGISYGF